MIIARRSFLIGLASALVVPAVVKLEAAERALGGEVVSAPVAPEMAWRRVSGITFHCQGASESRAVAVQVKRAGVDRPFLDLWINQYGGILSWSAWNPPEMFLFTPASPMVIMCEPPPKNCEAHIDVSFEARDGARYVEQLIWRDDRLISSSILPLELFPADEDAA